MKTTTAPRRIASLASSQWSRTVGLGDSTMRTIARLGQLLGLALPAVAVLLELGGRISLGQMLMMLVFAVCSFWIGRILEAYFGG